ncbi:hypothetical protein [Georgenia sp. H159]|uniref:hypothetical protein n=1 Tax=Georgenia sp. H159 TaxID=3076115 RepID=UPI002D78E92A|nr:hypothetical protein [Georgenia sp. H159]
MVVVESPGMRLSNQRDVEVAAAALAAGMFVAHAFANLYALTTRADAGTVRAVNIFKGRAADQVGSVTTTPVRLSGVFDLDRLPALLTASTVLGLIDELLCLGPFGFRGPAAAHIPDHLTVPSAGGRWVQAIVPGDRCASNAFLAACLDLCGTDHLHITSANRSRHATGAPEEPAHYRAGPLRAEFSGATQLLVLEHPDEDAAALAYPRHAPMSTTVLGFRHGRCERRPSVVVERYGSLDLDDVRAVVGRHGLGLDIASGARHRLPQRRY